ncbi:MAG TPA: extensin family protein [Mesorhizobium sp.]|nr:extensin family protein [Mesorhizobium sp.]
MTAARNLLWALMAAFPLAGLAVSAGAQETPWEAMPEMPDQAPLPQPKPTLGKLLPPAPAEPIQAPLPAPEPSIGKLLPPEPAPAEPSQAPLPSPKPSSGKLMPPESAPAAPEQAPAPVQAPAQAPSADAAVPSEEMLCRERLAALGVAFEPRPPVNDGESCAIPRPLWITRLGREVEMAPGGLMSCRLAEASAAWTQAAVVEARRVLGKELEALGQASTYVCRPRRSSGKMSEHATGDALDIASFAFADGSRLAVAPGLTGKEAEFLAAVRQAACGAFTTVLGPGSDADHADHLHLDVAERGSGPFCQ